MRKKEQMFQVALDKSVCQIPKCKCKYTEQVLHRTQYKQQAKAQFVALKPERIAGTNGSGWVLTHAIPPPAEKQAGTEKKAQPVTQAKHKIQI